MINEIRESDSSELGVEVREAAMRYDSARVSPNWGPCSRR